MTVSSQDRFDSPRPVLSVLIPAFNEVGTVEHLIDKVLQATLPPGVGRELVIVDDGSTDGTRDVLRRIVGERTEAPIRLFLQERNQGKGAAIRRAVAEATGDIMVVQDADLEYDPEEYGRLLLPILNGDADVVFGSRFLPGDYRRVLYFWHSVGNRVLTLLSNMMTDLNLSDMETCYKMARSSVFKSIVIQSNRFGIEPELTAKFARQGCRIYEVRISYRGRTYEEGKKITWWDGVKALALIFYFRFTRHSAPATGQLRATDTSSVATHVARSFK